MTWPEWVEHIGQFTIAKITGWIIGIIAVIAAARKVWPWLKAFVRMVDTIADLPDRLDKIEASQAVIEASQAKTTKELTDNHGSSLKDAVKRVEASVRKTARDLDVHIDFCKQRERLLDNDKE